MAVRAALQHHRRQPGQPGEFPRRQRLIQSADEPIPRLNLSGRFFFNDDLSMTRGRHNFKMGVSLEYNRKTEPGSADYMGNFDFGHNANNPLSTGNGYANMLLGVFTTYTELTSRVDRDVRHWQNDFYLQDNWRMTPRLTVDLRRARAAQRVGLRSQQHEQRLLHRSLEVAARRRACTGWSARPACPGNQACAAGNQRAIDPANPNVFFSTAFTGNIVQGSGKQINGIVTGGMAGKKPGTYFTFPYFTYAPRAGLAWNVTGDGKTAIRALVGDLLQLPAIDRRRRVSLRRRLPGLVHPPDPLGDVRRHHGRDSRRT